MTIVAVSCWSLTGMAAGQQAVADDETRGSPATGVQGQPQPPVTPPRPHNPGQELAAEQPEGPAIDIGPTKLRAGGYLGLTGIYRSTNSGGGPGTNFGTTPYEDILQGNVSETRLSAQSSRLSLRVDAPLPEARFNSLSGYFEMDFSGATPGNIAVSSSSAGFRLRQAFAEVLYGGSFSIAAGQAFSLMTPPRSQLSVWPSDYELSLAVDTNYVAGLVWDRAPQVRFTWRFSPRFNWAVSVENPEQQIGGGAVVLPACCAGDIAAQYNTGEQGLAVPNLTPDFVTRVAWNPTPAFHVDAGGVLRVFRHTVAPFDRDFKTAGGGASVNVRVNPARATRLTGQFASGAGLGRYVGGLAPDVVFHPDGSIAALRTSSWVLGIEHRLTPRVSAAGYYSGIAVEDAYFVDANGSLIGYGSPGSSNAANRRITEATAMASYQFVRTDNRGSAQLNLQTSWLRREPWAPGTGPDAGRAFLFFAQLRYNLP